MLEMRQSTSGPVLLDSDVVIPSVKRPLVIELVGPAGVGKTTLLRILSQRDRTIKADFNISKNRYARETLPLLTTFLRLHQPYKGLLWKEMKRILYLQGLHQTLKQEARKNHSAIVLDEGPVYMLSRMRVFNPQALGRLSFKKWWHAAITEWANTLDVIIWLDAQDSTLIRRIRTRNQPYPISDMSDSSAHKFISRYRSAFQCVIAELTIPSGPKVFRYMTDQETTDQIADKILNR